MPTSARLGSEPPANLFWLRSVRLLCACILLAVLVPWAVMLLRDSGGRWSTLIVLLIYSPLWAPYAWVFCRLSANPDSFIIRRSLILVASWAMLAMVLTSIFSLVVFEEGGVDSPSARIPAVIAVATSAVLLLSESLFLDAAQPR